MRISPSRWRNRGLCLAALAVALTAVAAPEAPAEATAAASEVDPAAMAALDGMGKYLQKLTAFHVSAKVQGEVVLDNGMKAQHGVLIEGIARKPNGLRVETTSDRAQRQYYFNGKEFTLWAPRLGFYATVPAPPTIRELVDTLGEKFDIEFPLVDLFRWGTDEEDVKAVTAAMDLGAGSIDGTTCEHYAFRQEGLDWQIWIQKGDFPLPRKLVLTTTTDDARPQYEAVYAWDLAPSFNDAAFTFDPPASAHRIALNEKPAEDGAGAQEAHND